MERNELVSALAALGMRCAATEIVIVGGAAAILCQWLERATVDVDVAFSDPRLSALDGAIEEVAEELGLPGGWINNSAKAFSGVLPPDFRERLIEVGHWGGLRVLAVGRRDFILMKLFAMRAEDVLDLHALAPTTEELDFVRGELPRIASFDSRRAHLIELYLEQGGST